MDAIRSFIAKTKSATPYGKEGELSARYGDNLIPYLNYVDVRNAVKDCITTIPKNGKIENTLTGSQNSVSGRNLKRLWSPRRKEKKEERKQEQFNKDIDTFANLYYNQYHT